MIVDFLGGCRQIGREAFLVRDKNTNLMLDYGVELQPEIQLPLLPTVKLDGVFVSHAHLDHSGMVPLLYKIQNPYLYVTPATLDLMNLLLEDYIKVAKLTRGFGEYTKYDLAKMNRYVKFCTYNQKFKIGGLQAELFDAHHIPGSASIFIKGSKSLLYTGDINMVETHLLSYKKKEYPKVDCLLMESTYSEKDHPNREEEEKRFISKILEYEHGTVLLPCFAVGRAQELLLILQKNKIEGDIYLDGMAQKASDLILYHKKYIKNDSSLKKVLQRVKFIRTKKQRDQIIRKGGIVVTTSGMLNGGPIVYYLERLRNNKSACLLFTGFQAPGTPGEKVLTTGYFENTETKFKVNIEIQKYDFSAHAGRTELFNLVEQISPKKVICVHGEHTKKFAKEIEKKFDIEAFAPDVEDSIEI